MSYVVIYESTHRAPLDELRLVVSAAGMPATISRESQHWMLLVDEVLADAAIAEIESYEAEKSDESPDESDSLYFPSGTVEGIFGYATTIILVGIISWYTSSGTFIGEAGALRAQNVLDGEWWRTFTALTLHVDFGHLFSNIAFGAIFGFLAGQLLGGGVAWLLILMGGASGNLVNAIVRDAEHVSIGASTAVFSALGIVVALAIRPSLRADQSTMRRWSPLIAGVLLLSFLGVGGERTDVSAHVTGFLSGLVGGWLASHLPGAWLTSEKLQWAAGLIAGGLVMLAWGAALTFGG